MTPEAIQAAIRQLIDTDLVEFDEIEEIVRIVGFHRQRPPENSSRTISLLNDFSAESANRGFCGEMRLRGITELLVAAVQRAQRWSEDSPEWPKLRNAFKLFLRQVYLENGSRFLAALSKEFVHASKSVKKEFEVLLPPLREHSQATLPPPCRHPGSTRDVDETRSKIDKYLDEEETSIGRKSNCGMETLSQHSDSPGLLRNVPDANRTSRHAGPMESTKSSPLAIGSK